MALMAYCPATWAQTTTYAFTAGTIEDEAIYSRLETEGRKLIDSQKIVSMQQLGSQLSRTECQATLVKPSTKVLADATIYSQCKKAVLVVGTLYKCSHCPNDHLRAATGFVIDESGLAVTSYHIFHGQATDENTDITVVVMDTEGNVYPITEVLAANLQDDVAIFRINTQGKKLYALPLGDMPQPGDDVNIIAHPHNMYYSFTTGSVSRLYKRDGGDKISVTADFSQGSSGGPVLDNKGNVIGIVSATRSLYNTAQHLQMVSREAIPVKAIRTLLSSK
jgi:serine protease Do